MDPNLAESCEKLVGFYLAYIKKSQVFRAFFNKACQWVYTNVFFDVALDAEMFLYQTISNKNIKLDLVKFAENSSRYLAKHCLPDVAGGGGALLHGLHIQQSTLGVQLQLVLSQRQILQLL